MDQILFILLATIVSIFIVLPLLQHRSGRAQMSLNNKDHRTDELEERKETIYTSIKEIDFDYQMGKLSKEDHEELRARYKNDAIAILKELDKVKGRAGSAKSRTQSDKTSVPAVNFCWQCGTALVAGDKFCENCGNQIEKA